MSAAENDAASEVPQFLLPCLDRLMLASFRLTAFSRAQNGQDPQDAWPSWSGGVTAGWQRVLPMIKGKGIEMHAAAWRLWRLASRSASLSCD